MSDYKQCQECGDDSDKYIAFILYDCSECIKKKLCGSCMEWTNFNTKNKKPFCPECYDKKEVCCECGSDDQCDDQYFCLYKCCKCNEYNICNKCINWTNEDRGDPICSVCNEKYIQEQREKCFDTTFIKECNDCHKLCRSEFSTCWTCHKTDICEDCITMYPYDDCEELCTACSQAKDENEKKRERAYREESEKRKAEHRRNWPHLFPTFSEKVEPKP